MSKKTILHLAPFIWTMGYKKGIFGVQAYLLFEKFGYNVFFIAPDINLFDPTVKINNEMLKKARMSGVIFDFENLIGASKLLNKTGRLSFLNKSAYFFLNMLICFSVSLKALSGLRNVACIYAHTWVCLPPAFLLSKLFGIPCIYRVYGIHNYKIGLVESLVSALLKIDLLMFKIPCDAYVITDDGTMGKAVAVRMGVPENKILFIHTGVPDDFFVNANSTLSYAFGDPWCKLNLLSERKKVLYVGRLVEWKRIDRLIQVLYSVCQKDPKLNVCLIIAGDGPMLGSLKKLVVDMNLEGKVFFLGSVKRSQLNDLFVSCDIYLTLQDLSNLTNSLLEAMARGRCVVAGDIGGTRNVIIDNDTGFLVPLHDIEEISSLVVKLLSNDDLRLLIGQRAKMYAENNFMIWSNRMKYELEWISKKVLS
jgi:glycosyltransferase involved in cell wall biosynthesis